MNNHHPIEAISFKGTTIIAEPLVIGEGEIIGGDNDGLSIVRVGFPDSPCGVIMNHQAAATIIEAMATAMTARGSRWGRRLGDFIGQLNEEERHDDE